MGVMAGNSILLHADAAFNTIKNCRISKTSDMTVAYSSVMLHLVKLNIGVFPPYPLIWVPASIGCFSTLLRQHTSVSDYLMPAQLKSGQEHETYWQLVCCIFENIKVRFQSSSLFWGFSIIGDNLMILKRKDFYDFGGKSDQPKTGRMVIHSETVCVCVRVLADIYLY